MTNFSGARRRPSSPIPDDHHSVLHKWRRTLPVSGDSSCRGRRQQRPSRAASRHGHFRFGHPASSSALQAASTPRPRTACDTGLGRPPSAAATDRCPRRPRRSRRRAAARRGQMVRRPATAPRSTALPRGDHAECARANELAIDIGPLQHRLQSDSAGGQSDICGQGATGLSPASRDVIREHRLGDTHSDCGLLRALSATASPVGPCLVGHAGRRQRTRGSQGRGRSGRGSSAR